MSVSFDFIHDVIDEIALEGLDGITIGTLFIRLLNRDGFCLMIDENSKDFIWRSVALHHELEFFLLPKSRADLVLFNRYDHRDPETEMCLELKPDDVPMDIYPIKVVSDPEKRVQGSCMTFDTRKNITNDIRIGKHLKFSYADAIRRYGNSLVIVASQKLRWKTLLGEAVDPQIELNNIQYVMLELVGRSRTHGVVTTGQVASLSGLNESPKSLFYHRKLLLKKQLIRRQCHYQRNKATTQWGYVFHLPKFYIERPTSVNLLFQKMCNILATKPKQQERLAVLRNEVGIPETTFKKMVARGQPLSQFTDLCFVPYREMYPDAQEAEYLNHKKVEKEIKVIRLIKAFSINTLMEEDDANNEDDDEDSVSDKGNPICDTRRLQLNKPMVCQAYDILYESGPEGMSERDFRIVMGLSRLEARSLCRYLTRNGAVSNYMKDKGRQRMAMYVASELLHKSRGHQRIVHECKKLLSNDQMVNPATDSNESRASVPVILNNCISRSRIQKPEVRSKNNEADLDAERCSTSADDSNVSFSSGVTNMSPNPSYISKKHLTARQLTRASYILDTVRQSLFVDDIHKLVKVIVDEESKEGFTDKPDRRSVLRIIQSLVNDGFIKSMKTMIKLNETVKQLHFVCMPEITSDHPLVKTAIENAKAKLCGLNYSEMKKVYRGFKKFKTKQDTMDKELEEILNAVTIPTDPSAAELLPSIKDSITKVDILNQPGSWQEKLAKMCYHPNMGRYYGLQPKFCRMEILHQLLFYLGYDHNVHQNNGSKERNADSDDIGILMDDGPSMTQVEQPVVHSESKDWKMFVPPLPKHKDVDDGWYLLGDVFLRVPLSLFVQIIHIRYKIDGLCDYLDNPLKKHYLIKHLPIKLRNSLLMGHRSISRFYDIVVGLKHMGLVTIGPQILKDKDKDKVFLYVHRIGSVMDTTISDPAYQEITPGKNYSWRFHFFSSVSDVHNYWTDLMNVCVNTPLGKRPIVDQQPMDTKLALVRLNKETPHREMGPVADEGNVPGDHLGAGGLDSSFFSHLKRSWSRQPVEVTQIKHWKKKQVKEKELIHDNKDVPLNELLKQEVVHQPKEKKKRLNRLPKQTGIAVLNTCDSNTTPLVAPVTLEKNYVGAKNKPKLSQQTAAVKRKLSSPDISSSARKMKVVKIDAKDETVKGQMKTMRAVWSTQEDTFFVLANVASFVMGVANKLPVLRSVLRDEHERYCSKFGLKTSTACLRRFNSTMKNEKKKNAAVILYEEAKQYESMKVQIDLSETVWTSEEMNDEFRRLIRELMYIMENEKTYKPILLPNTVDELRERYVISVSANRELKPEKIPHVNPKNVVAIYCNVVFNVIQIALYCVNVEHVNYNFHLYKIFQQYPDNLLRSVLTRMRKDRLISTRKTLQRKKISRLSAFSVSPFQMSMYYKHALLMRYQPEIFTALSQMYNDMCVLSETTNHFIKVCPNDFHGIAAGVLSMMANRTIIFRTEVPDQTILLSEEVNEMMSAKKQRLSKRSETETSDQSDRNKSESSVVKFSKQSDEEVHGLSASRMHLYLMRKQFVNAPDVKNVQYSGHHFFLSLCNIYCRLRPTSDNRCLNYDKDYVLGLTKSDVIDVNNFVDVNQVCNELNLSDEETDVMNCVYNEIKSKKFAGVTHHQLLDLVGQRFTANVRLTLLSMLKLMCRRSLIVRVGVECYMYVVLGHIHPWLTHAIVVPKDKRLSLAVSVDLVKGSPATSCEGFVVDDQPSPLPGTSCEDTSTKKRKRKSKLPFSIAEVPPLKESDCKNVDIIAKPWYKPDGGVNKAVLYDMLISVCGNICTKPGIKEESIIENYSPFLQPVSILEILEMLENSGCIRKLLLLKTSSECGPFGKSSYELTQVDGIYEDSKIFYEAEPDALLKIARMKSDFNV